MKFRPIVRAVRPMSAKIFQHGRMGLTEILEDLDLSDRLAYDRDRNILFLNFEGLRVRRPEDIETIRAAVASKAAQIGRRVAAIVNYDAFQLDEDIAQQYATMVRDLEGRHYTKVSRYTTSAFMRIKLGQHLRRTVRPHIFENRADAQAFHEKTISRENVV